MKISYFNEKAFKAPKVIYREKAYWDILSLMNSKFAEKSEFMFFGVVEKVVNKTYFIKEFRLIPNEKNSGAYCENDETKWNDWVLENFPNPKDAKGLRVHSHSHVNMGVTPSSTDNEQFMQFANNISDFFIQLIVNHKEEHTTNLVEVDSGLKYEGVPSYIQVGNYIYDRTTKKIHYWNEETSEIKEEVSITDGNYDIVDKEILFDDILKYSFTENSFVLDGDLCILTPGKASMLRISDEEEKAIEEEFDKLIKKSTPAYTAPNYNYNYNNTSYGGYYGSGSTKVWDSKLAKWVDKTPSASPYTGLPAQTSTPAVKTPVIDDDDKKIIEFYKNSERKKA